MNTIHKQVSKSNYFLALITMYTTFHISVLSLAKILLLKANLFLPISDVHYRA